MIVSVAGVEFVIVSLDFELVLKEAPAKLGRVCVVPSRSTLALAFALKRLLHDLDAVDKEAVVIVGAGPEVLGRQLLELDSRRRRERGRVVCAPGDLALDAVRRPARSFWRGGRGGSGRTTTDRGGGGGKVCSAAGRGR